MDRQAQIETAAVSLAPRLYPFFRQIGDEGQALAVKAVASALEECLPHISSAEAASDEVKGLKRELSELRAAGAAILELIDDKDSGRHLTGMDEGDLELIAKFERILKKP